MESKAWKDNNTLLKLKEAMPFEEDIPQYLYHATFAAHYRNIMKKGIVPNKFTNFDWGDDYRKSGCVYLGADEEFCGSMLECTENEDIPEEWLDNIIVLKIDTNYLNLDNLYPDENFQHGEPDENGDYLSFQYKGIIPPEAIVGKKRYI